jgi:hypothetical protein
MATSKKAWRRRVGRVTVYQRGGRFWIYYRDCTPVRRPVGTSREEALAVAAKINAQLADGGPTMLAFQPIAVTEMIAKWLDHHEHVRRSPARTSPRSGRLSGSSASSLVKLGDPGKERTASQGHCPDHAAMMARALDTAPGIRVPAPTKTRENPESRPMARAHRPLERTVEAAQEPPAAQMARQGSLHHLVPPSPPTEPIPLCRVHPKAQAVTAWDARSSVTPWWRPSIRRSSTPTRRVSTGSSPRSMTASRLCPRLPTTTRGPCWKTARMSSDACAGG